MIRSRTFRWLLAAALAVVIAAAGLRLALLDGWLRTVRIDGPSMAPGLAGTHRRAACDDCGIRFRVDAERLPESGRLVCPNCGFREIDAAIQPAEAGDTVLVDRWPLLTRMPRRWEVVAYDDPHEPGPAVKRVAGLPGEKIQIRDGDLYADGRIIRKSLSEFWQTAVLVHDDAHRPKSLTEGNPEEFLRWRPGVVESGWRTEPAGYCYESGTRAEHSPDWLEYIHWRCDASLTPRDEPAAILDNDAYNQALPRRLNEVHDVVLTGEVKLADSGQLTVRLHVRGSAVAVRLSANQAIAEAEGRELASVPLKLGTVRPLKFAVGQFDKQLAAAVGGQWVIAVPLESAPHHEASGAVRPKLAIAANRAATVRSLRVWRDIYLLEPRGTGRPWSADHPLGEGEYFVLGDNAPVSIDSRHWNAVGIPRQRLRGVVLGPQRAAP